MQEFRIRIEEDFTIAEKVLKRWQYFMYSKAIKSLMNIIYSSVKKYQLEKTGRVRLYIERGPGDFINLERRRFESFMFSEERELRGKKYKQYERAMNDRWLAKVIRNAHKFKGNIKSKAIRSALGGTDVLGFFAKLGIYITWEVVEENKKI